MAPIESNPTFAKAADNVIDALRQAAVDTTKGIIAYTSNSIGDPSDAHQLSYKELLDNAKINATRLHQQGLSKRGAIVLVHFDDALDSIVWYWSTLLSGAIPAVTSPAMFRQSSLDRQKHLSHLYNTLENPLCLTRRSLISPFEEQRGENLIKAYAIEDLESDSTNINGSPTIFSPSPSDIIALMLTSGSSGNAKAVQLTNQEVLASCRGKTFVGNMRRPNNPFLSWVHMDHVANLVHCHIQAIVARVSQIQVPAADFLADPLQFLNLASRHQVSSTFAPNFFLARLRRQLESKNISTLDSNLNVEALYIDTGGEATVTEVCVALQSLLSPYGAPENMIIPGFGMTETCAGCTRHYSCPSYDNENDLEFTSLGRCITGARMRITCLDNFKIEAKPGEHGSLEITGEVVFKKYFNNTTATAEAFTEDGWFRTGDLAYIDNCGHLHLCGRTKDVININGVKYLPHELESALEQAEISGAIPSYFCCFGTRNASMDTEVVAILYLPSYAEDDDSARFETQNSIIRVASTQIYSRPRIVPLRIQDMPKSTLGKLSRTKLKTALEGGQFAVQKSLNEEAIKRYRRKRRGDAETPEELVILDIIRNQLDIAADEDLDVKDSVFEMGATSMDLVAIMRRINRHFQPSRAVRLTDLLSNSTARDLAVRIFSTVEDMKHVYDPTVVLQSRGKRTPLWLVHPGVGEILVFVNLAHHITERPVYALRAKGFNAAQGEAPFNTLEEIFETYYSAIKRTQPHGPYAIAGYSYGSMIAFEVTKLLERQGDEVRYCGNWNLPPHIKSRMRDLSWEECVINLFYFVGLMNEVSARSHKAPLCEFELKSRRLDAIYYLRQYCDQNRWKELGLNERDYLLWVELATKMQAMARDYDPEGRIKCMDVFVADPLSSVARNRKDWVDNRLAAWRNFVREDVRFHDVQGAHYTMLNQEYVASFANKLRTVLKDREV